MRRISGYEVLEQIHDGERARVYRARRDSDGLTVLVKVHASEYPSFADIVRFQNHYNIARGLASPEIVRPLSLEAFGNGLALVMVDVGGVSLDRYIEAERPGLDAILDIAIRITQALEGIHARGLIHKDIKPSNVLIHPETKQVWLTDFGISSYLPRESQEVRGVRVLEGTLAYMSPEQTGRMNRWIDYRSDFYSLGVVLYELLTRRLPFESSDPLELIHGHIARRPPPPHEVSVDVPRMASDIAMKLLSKAAELRYQSASGLRSDLETCAARLRANDPSSFTLGQRDISDRFTIPEKLYGREAEIETLMAAFDRVSKGAAEIMLVAGFSGIGKSALVNEVHGPIVRRRGYFVSGKFDQYTRNIPFSSLAHVFRSLIRQIEVESGERIARWKGLLLDAMGAEGQVMIDVIPELEALIGKQPPVAKLSPADVQERFNAVFQRFIQVFARAEHPLVVFLDDLQWADAGSLKLIQALMSEQGTRYLLLMGAYRDNEIDPAHPWSKALGHIRSAGATVNQLNLAPLDLPSLSRMVRDTLGAGGAEVESLAELVHQNTAGNPFFSNQFLRALHHDGFIVYSPTEGHWKCDVPAARSLAVSSDVVKFMVQQIGKLTPRTQAVLSLAACIDNRFDLDTLAVVHERSRAETADDLWSALQHGLVLPVDEAYKLFQGAGAGHNGKQGAGAPKVQYRFLHDRVQQAAYMMIPEAERQSTHLRIGRLLLRSTPGDQMQERLFDIAEHLNMAMAILDDPAERAEVARINLLAGRKAKASTAYAAAVKYLRAGTELLSAQSWADHYELTLALYKERAETEYLEGDFDASAGLIGLSIERARTPIERAQLYLTLIVQQTLQGRYGEAVQVGRRALALIGVELPEDDLLAARDAEMAQVERSLRGRDIASLLDLPEMTSPEQKVAMKLLMAMAPPNYRAHQALWSVIVAKAVNLCIQHGNAPEASYCHTAYGALLAYVKNDYRAGEAFQEMGLRLCERYNIASEKSVAYIIAATLRHWTRPMKVVAADYAKASEFGLSSGNLQFAAYTFGHNMVCRFYQGVNLEQVLTEIREHLAFSIRRKNQWAIDLLLGGQILFSELALIDPGDVGDAGDEKRGEYLAMCRAHRSQQVICLYNILRAEVLFVLGRFDEALACSDEADAQIIFVATQGLLPSAEHVFIRALILAALFTDASAAEKERVLAELARRKAQLEMWADNCPENFLHQHLLVAAEIARITGENDRAIELYDRAIEAASANDFTQHAAMANELAGAFWSMRGRDKVARAYLIDAYYGYVRWGAKRKQEVMEARWGLLLGSLHAGERVAPRSAGALPLEGQAGLLDISTVTKASQAISSEIVLDRLLTRLLQIIIENAGAQRGCLLLAHGGRLTLEAEGVSDPPHVSTLPSLPVEEDHADAKVCAAIVHHVARTMTSIILSDAASEGPFKADPYVLRNAPSSVLCAPIRNHGQLLGVVYFENNATRDAFTRERLELLGMLSAQAAISIENAVLVDQLERRVRERTRELEEAQRQLVTTARKAGMAEVTVNVLHNVNNVITSVGVTSSLMRERLMDDRTFSLHQLDALLREHEGDLAVFLTTDPRGKAVPSFIGQLAERQGEARRALISSVASITTHLEHIQAIISREQAHARATPVLEEVEISALIEEALLIAGGSDGWQGTALMRDYAAIPAVRTDRHTVLSILVNLISNARHALADTPPGSRRLQVRLALSGPDGLTIEVSDNGMGISPENMSSIFRHGFTTRSGGHGFGLHSGVLSARSRGGDLTAFSGGPGLGATFTIKLPYPRAG